MITETVLTTSFVTGLFKKFGEEAGSYLLKRSKSHIQKLKLYKSLLSNENDYSNNIIKRVFTFRTIVSGDKDVYLDQIYYPLTILENGVRKATIRDGTTLPSHTPICLIGVAGQGKTITMKKMYLEELNKKNSFPFFISLRSLDFSKELSLIEILHKHLTSNGVECDKESVNDFITNVNIRIYFDGFDEIPYEHRQSAVYILEECHYRWKCSIVCSTRPDTELCQIPGFAVYNLSYLVEKDVHNILKQKIENRETAEQLINLLKNKEFLRDSIKTPIIIDIFIVTCMSLNENPDNISNYYDSLFKSLTYKHDFNKIFTRKRKSQLSDLELEDCFTIFCFTTFIQEKVVFTEDDMLDIYKEAKQTIGKENEKEKDIMQDIMNITNLVIADGYTNFTFIHKSIQDYYAAKYISKSDIANQELFWENMQQYNVEENFAYMCKSLSPYTYHLIFITSQLEKSGFYSSEGDPIYPTLDDLEQYLQDAVLVKSSRKRNFFNGISRVPLLVCYRFEAIEELYKFVVFKDSINSPMSCILHFTRDKKDEIENEFSKLEPYMISNYKGMHESVIKLEDFRKVFPEVERYMHDSINDMKTMIDEIIRNYHNQINKNKSRSIGTKNLLKNLFAKK